MRDFKVLVLIELWVQRLLHNFGLGSTGTVQRDLRVCVRIVALVGRGQALQ